MGSRWYTADLRKVTIAISAFVPPWHQSMYRGVEEMCIKCQEAGSDSFLQVGVCCESLANQVLLKWSKEIQITGPHTVKRIYDYLQPY